MYCAYGGGAGGKVARLVEKNEGLCYNNFKRILVNPAVNAAVKQFPA